jgi:hypothetical protein
VSLWTRRNGLAAGPARPRQLASVHDSGSYVYTVVFAPDGRTVAAASTGQAADLLQDGVSPAGEVCAAPGQDRVGGAQRIIGGRKMVEPIIDVGELVGQIRADVAEVVLAGAVLGRLRQEDAAPLLEQFDGPFGSSGLDGPCGGVAS